MNEYIKYIKERLKGNSDFKHRKVYSDKGNIHIMYIDNLCDSKFISQFIIMPFMEKEITKFHIENIKQEILYGANVGDITTTDDALLHILSGDVVIAFDFMTSLIFCEAKGFNKRSITTPITEQIIKGPREGFNEVIVDNISLIRRKIKNSNLEVEIKTIGKKSNTAVAILYIKGVAPDSLVGFIRDKINQTDLDFLLDTNYIEEQIKSKRTFFDTIGYTEKPDIAAAKILEGRVSILVDGSPFAITAPFFFLECFQMGDDYYLNKYYTSFTRIVRILAFSISALGPGLYLALTTYHFTLIPLEFVFRLSSSRADVPFPTSLEILLMLFFFQLLREAGVRLPQPVGQAMSIVGALILGQSAVGAGLASQSTVVIIALSSISSFLVPRLYSALTFWTAIILLLASLLGLIGFFMGLYAMAAHLGALDSCGYPYIFPVSTKNTFDYRDTALRDDLKDVSKNIFIEDKKK
ncbi:spore germination protein [Clostridium sp. DJ247]|uniref:spore germination protein n=1 Tax=Clostridium sp. DJ247 TaxID=2726188 RepID=UPI00162AEDC5|nr:spore germination protein [Clostridium sp. DJ247]MBC2579479.1 spore germination protein [Clostridium sp. DJ247]